MYLIQQKYIIFCYFAIVYVDYYLRFKYLCNNLIDLSI